MDTPFSTLYTVKKQRKRKRGRVDPDKAKGTRPHRGWVELGANRTGKGKAKAGERLRQRQRGGLGLRGSASLLSKGRNPFGRLSPVPLVAVNETTSRGIATENSEWILTQSAEVVQGW